MTDTVKSFNVIHQKHLKIAWVDTYMIAALGNEVKYKGSNRIEGFLTRFEFSEVLIRLAKARFVESKICVTVGEAFDKLITEHIIPNV